MMTKLMLEHAAAYHENAIEKMQKATDLKDGETYAYFYGQATGIELAVEIACGPKVSEALDLARKKAGFGSEASPCREI